MSAPLSPPGYEAARTSAGIIDRHHERGRLVVSGADRRSYLHGLLTNDITALTPGTGCYACYLTAQGRMITDLWVHELGDVLLLTLPLQTKDGVLAKLDQFIFSEDVQLGDVTDTFATIAVLGPDAARAVAHVVTGVLSDQLAQMAEGGNVRGSFAGEPAIVLRAGDAGVPAFDLLVAAAQFDACVRALRAAGATELSPAAADVLRVEGGIARFHQDMDETIIPLEVNLERRAISQTKGCYVGQEVIIRVLHRGHGRVAKRLVGLVLEGDAVPVVAAGGADALDKAATVAIRATGDAAEREVGRVTSAVFSPALKAPIALGYVHRDFVEPGTRVTVDGVPAVVSALPFVQ